MRRSKTARLPKALLDEVEKLWATGKFTLDEVVAKLREMGVDDVSRSSLGRYLHNSDKALARMRAALDLGDRWFRECGRDPEGKTATLISQMLKSLAYRVADDLEGKPDGAVKPMDLMLCAKAFQSIASGEKVTVDRELKLREKLKTDLEKKIDETKKSAPADQAAMFEKAKEMVRGLL